MCRKQTVRASDGMAAVARVVDPSQDGIHGGIQAGDGRMQPERSMAHRGAETPRGGYGEQPEPTGSRAPEVVGDTDK
ncbi:hypothetical protein JX265_013234 [Neoarthrinium moseri]|uniref:Uncharacterized protein n=1 Tax=Neoarthrinium moseri TaxID=1658444 RepID=A0A9P9W935_9PEZI|nr:hypothetical protein JX266_013265 [Neoarthrinium moseri]KAI1851487.1 hypothetical protein JX265_013234 [Neoarthrinium moseri]